MKTKKNIENEAGSAISEEAFHMFNQKYRFIDAGKFAQRQKRFFIDSDEKLKTEHLLYIIMIGKMNVVRLEVNDEPKVYQDLLDEEEDVNNFFEAGILPDIAHSNVARKLQELRITGSLHYVGDLSFDRFNAQDTLGNENTRVYIDRLWMPDGIQYDLKVYSDEGEEAAASYMRQILVKHSLDYDVLLPKMVRFYNTNAIKARLEEIHEEIKAK